MDTIGQRLYELRKEHRFTQEGLASELNVSRQSVSNWELDKSLPDTERLFALAKLYNVSLDEIVYGKKEPQVKDTDSLDQSVVNVIEYEEEPKALKIVQAIGILITTVMLAIALIFTIGLTKRFASDSDVMNSDYVTIDHVLEQYSYVEVSRLDVDGNYYKDRVWLDSRNLSEEDNIFCFTDENNPKKMKFEYYSKTLVVPLIVTFALLVLDVVLVLSITNVGMKKPAKEREKIEVEE